MLNAITIDSSSILNKLQQESMRTGICPVDLIEKLINKSIETRLEKQKRYQAGLELLLKDVCAVRSKLFNELKQEASDTGKLATRENVYDSDICVIIGKVDLGADRTVAYNREYEIMFTHPNTNKVIKFVVYYSLGILMNLQFSVSSLIDGKMTKDYSKKFKSMDNKDKVKAEILAYLKTLEVVVV